MIRQLFANAGGVPEAGRATGAAPFSLALHAVAIGGLLFLSSQKIASTDARPPIPVYQPPVEATALPVVVKMEPRAAQPVGRRLAGAPKAPAPNVATPPPLVPPTEAVDDPKDHFEINPGPETTAGPGAGLVCPDCLIGPAAVSAPPGDGPAAPLVRISIVDAPRKMHDAAPRYPDIAKKIHLEGEVILDCTIGVDGHVRETKVLQGHPLLAPAAVEAVRQWVYTPTRLNGQPIAVLLTVTVKFHITR